MTLPTESDMSYLELAYRIGCEMQKREPLAASFSYGVNPLQEQTEKGIVFEIFDGTIRRLHTPLGFWNLGCRANWVDLPGEFVKIEADSVTKKTLDAKGPFFGLVKWEGTTYDPPTYKRPDQYLPRPEVIKAWNEFASTHPSLQKQIF